MSVVVTLASDSTVGIYDPSFLKRCLQSLAAQTDAPSMDILVPYPSSIDTFSDLQDAYPGVEFIPVNEAAANEGPGPRHTHFDLLRASGLARARAAIVAMVEDQEILDPSWAAHMLAAHRNQVAAVGGSVENGIDRPLNWAVYFCDFINYQNPFSPGESTSASDVNISYKTECLQAVRSAWQDGFHEPIVHSAIQESGGKIVLEPKAVVYQARTGLSLKAALKERIIWGRHYAAHRQRAFPRWKALAFAAFTFLLPVLLAFRKTGIILRKGRNIGPFFKALPLTILLLLFWSFGEMAGYLTGES